MKWEFARAAEGDRKIVICNADEGEPGTFKDRVLLTELADRIFAGMTIAGYAIGAAEGIVYLRAEYAYLIAFPREAFWRSAAATVGWERALPESRDYRLRHPDPAWCRGVRLRRGNGADQFGAKGIAANRRTDRRSRPRKGISVVRPSSTTARRCAA